MRWDSCKESYTPFNLLTVSSGHNWGSEHDPDTGECSPSTSSGGKFLMYMYSVSGIETNNKVHCIVASVRAPSQIRSPNSLPNFCAPKIRQKFLLAESSIEFCHQKNPPKNTDIHIFSFYLEAVTSTTTSIPFFC